MPSDRLHPDRIEVRGLRAVGTIGVLPEEQTRAQPFEIDLVIESDIRNAGRTDDLDQTVNYAAALAMAAKVVESEPTLLLERVASRIAEEILGMARVDAVEVTVRKLRPPVPEDVQTTGVSVRRTRVDLFRPQRFKTTAYVALGANLGDRREHLRYAVGQLPDVTRCSGVYETAPVGGPEQGQYLNMVVELETDLNPFELLETCLAIEAGAGRERLVRWGARTLDLDVLLWGEASIVCEQLTVPHPRMWERRFVLQPLAELAPGRLPEDWDRRLPEGGITRVDDLER
ncbi:MAG: 2-amino-4-hydroxy-6-hydroxymethyldihydropteridine diphosphokinase [Actinomycetota bacterium]|nr:2-amino-4-hydroxy-6-hydroxymethyldihydropteridine diphosphokinase [Actinomycetota bacterium]